MLAYFAEALPAIMPEVHWEFYGYDVADFGVPERDAAIGAARARLSANLPDVPWDDRLKTVSVTDALPWADGFFSVIVSNQVGEHVYDIDHWFREQRRVLGPRGLAAHLFPLQSSWYESHIFVPFAHWFRSHDAMAAYIRAARRLGLKTPRSGENLPWSADSLADYIRYNTFYRTGAQLLDTAKRAHLRGAFRFTGGLYGAHLRRLLRRRPRLSYAATRSALADLLAYHAFKYVASVTLVLERHNAYLEPDTVDAGEAPAGATGAQTAARGGPSAAPAPAEGAVSRQTSGRPTTR